MPSWVTEMCVCACMCERARMHLSEQVGHYVSWLSIMHSGPASEVQTSHVEVYLLFWWEAVRIRGPTKEDSNVPVDLVIRSVVARRHSKPETLSSLGDLPKLPLSSVPWDEDNAYVLGFLGRFEVGHAHATVGHRESSKNTRRKLASHVPKTSVSFKSTKCFLSGKVATGGMINQSCFSR